MFLSEVLEQLHHGELSKLFVGGTEEAGGISEEHYPKIISFINLAMIDLYRKFDLLKKEVDVQQYLSITEYLLTDDYAFTDPNSSGETLYIIDSVAKPFLNDVLQITEVFDEDDDEVPLDDVTRTDSVFTSDYNKLTIPVPLNSDPVRLLTVKYRSYPVKIALHNQEPTTLSIALPDQFLTALLAFIGYRAHITMPLGESSQSSSNYARYMGIVNEIKAQGTVNKDNRTNQKLDINDWA